MNPSYPITIVGGGLAGLTLGIGLRQRGVPVTVWEVGRYPRHRVCGEFISGRGQGSLARLGLLAGLHAVGARPLVSAAFFDSGTRVAARPLPESALSVSRHVVDDWLAREFQRNGGELRVGERWVGSFGEGIVRASGRQAEKVTDGWRYFGLKVHARDIRMESDLELHFVEGGYVGLCQLADGEVNICGLFRSESAVSGLAQDWPTWLRGAPNSTLHTRLATAAFDPPSFCAVAGLSLTPRRASQRLECCVGDALTLIPPLTGNGMSMAFESAELALDPLTKFSRGAFNWNEAQQRIAQACDRRFASRLRWAQWLQRALFQPTPRSIVLTFAAHSEWCWRALFGRTR